MKLNEAKRERTEAVLPVREKYFCIKFSTTFRVLSNSRIFRQLKFCQTVWSLLILDSRCTKLMKFLLLWTVWISFVSNFKVARAIPVFLDPCRSKRGRKRKKKKKQCLHFASGTRFYVVKWEDRRSLIKFLLNNVEHWYRSFNR